MNKTFALCAAVALTLLGTPSRAQDAQVANHLAFGITAGLDGVGLELALPMTPYVQFRAGYSVVPYTYQRTVSMDLREQGGEEVSFPLAVTLWKGGTGKFLVDLYPGKKTGFHFTLGAYVGPGKFASAEGDLREVLSPDEYATLPLELNDNVVFTSDSRGYASADVKLNVLTPYAGLGFGRAVKPGSRVKFCFDLGALITGGSQRLQMYDYRNNSAGDPVVIRSENLNNEDNGWINKVSDFPVVPFMKFSLFFRLF